MQISITSHQNWLKLFCQLLGCINDRNKGRFLGSLSLYLLSQKSQRDFHIIIFTNKFWFFVEECYRARSLFKHSLKVWLKLKPHLSKTFFDEKCKQFTGTWNDVKGHVNHEYEFVQYKIEFRFCLSFCSTYYFAASIF